MTDGTKLISVDNKLKRFVVKNKTFSYALQVEKAGYLQNLHWGGIVKRNDDLPSTWDISCYRHLYSERSKVMRQEYPGWGGAMFTEPALKADLPDGVRNTLLKYQGYETLVDNVSETLIITLSDDSYPLDVKLYYKVYRDTEILDRWSEIVNRGEAEIELKSIMSACWQLPRSNKCYRLTHLAGRWGKEGTIEQLSLTQNKTVLESRTGLSGPFAMPFFALDGNDATEEFGRVWFGTLHWSGNWKIAVELNPYEQVSVCGGINDFDFSWSLKPGKKFTTPVFSGGYTPGGFGEASRILHRYQRLYIEPENRRGQFMPMVYNSHASLRGENLTAEKTMQTMDLAAQIGTELFVIDSGWQKALGEWEPDLSKFPDGMKPVINHCNNLGMKFGLWMEIESIDDTGNIYREHPDWLMSFPGRSIIMDGPKDRILLNFAKNQVKEYIYASVYKLLKENHIEFLKIDMNRYFTNPGGEGNTASEQKKIWVKYVRNLYEILDRLRKEFPYLIIENCASGGARSDLAMSRFCGRINRSDNQDTLDILRLHEGFTWLHQSKLAGGACHISDAYAKMVNRREVPLQYQAFVGMLGSLAISKNLLECSDEMLSQLGEYVDLYKRLRHVTHLGQLYRLASHHKYPYAVFEYVSDDKKEAVVFIFGHSVQFAYKVPAIRLQGLDEDSIYDIEIFGNKPQTTGYTASIQEYQPISGAGLTEIGVRVELLGDFDARILYLKASDKNRKTQK